MVDGFTVPIPALRMVPYGKNRKLRTFDQPFIATRRHAVP